MKDKKSIIWLTIGFAVLIAMLWIPPREEPRLPAPVVEIPPAAKSVVTPPPVVKAMKAKGNSHFAEAPANEEEMKSLIPFKVKGKFAVAYGDVILGEVEPGSNLEEGFYRPDPIRLWNETEIPYAIDPGLPNPKRIEDALRYIQKNSRVVFVPFQGQEDAIVFEPTTEHCLSVLGKMGGHQPIKLAANCGRTEILHEVMHALGFIHEHSRPDRDEFVEVIWDNVDDKFRDQFAKAPEGLSDPSRGTRFDYQSIMLYPPDLFGKKPGQITLKARGGGAIRPVENALSEGDFQRLRDTYR